MFGLECSGTDANRNWGYHLIMEVHLIMGVLKLIMVQRPFLKYKIGKSMQYCVIEKHVVLFYPFM